jgi:hypothetical protein
MFSANKSNTARERLGDLGKPDERWKLHVQEEFTVHELERISKARVMSAIPSHTQSSRMILTRIWRTAQDFEWLFRCVDGRMKCTASTECSTGGSGSGSV